MAEPGTTTRAVAGLRVVDLSRVLAGPLCTQYLGDMGAEVIKVEAPVGGDETRGWPVLLRSPEGRRTSSGFLSVNRNKRSIALDMKSPEGRDVVLRLARRADVVVESFAPGVAAKLGIDAATLRALEPRLVYCSISGFGSVGPLAHGKGYDVILQAFSGMLEITGDPGSPPMRSPFSPVDQATGLHALIGILALLHERERTGRGGMVEASLFDTATGFLGYFLQSYWARGTEPERAGSGHESLCPYEAFDTADKPLILGVANDGLWRRFCTLAGLEAFADRPEFRTNADRVKHRDATVALVKAKLRERTRDDWIAALSGAGIPCSPLHTLGELATHPHSQASGMIRRLHDPAIGDWQTVSQPLRFDGQRATPHRPPPSHGADARAVLAAAGLTDEDIAALIAGGVVRR